MNFTGAAWRRGSVTAVVTVAACVAAPGCAVAKTWFVRASAAGGGDGSVQRPFGTLAVVEGVATAGDTIKVLASPAGTPALGGGIALKANQKLIGDGPPVTSLGASAAAPRVANAGGGRHKGDAVVLADGAEVANLVISGAYRGGIYGSGVTGVSVHDNVVTATNTSCATGFVVQPFVLPTLVPGVGVPFSSGLPNGWAAIMVDEREGAASLSIAGNVVHDAGCADGIDIRASGDARVTAHVHHNRLTGLRQDPRKQSVLAIGMQTRDTAQLTAEVEDNTETSIGTATLGDLGLADSEGVFANSSGRSRLVAHIRRNTFAHGLGHLSANCLEVVASNGGPTMEATISDSTCDHVVGDILEAANLSKDATLTLNVERVRAAHSTFVAAPAFHQVEPGDDGDCLLLIASGSGSTTQVNITDSQFTDCAADGLGVVSNVVDGIGAPVRRIGFDVSDSRIIANRLSNLRIATATDVTELHGRIENSDLSRSATPIILEQVDLSPTGQAIVDLGGGALGSAGHNCILGGALADVTTVGYDVTARHNWWGAAGGPGLGRTLAVGATIAADEPLAGPSCGPASTGATAPSRACASRRRFVLHLPRGWRRATVSVAGRRTPVTRKQGRLVATIDLRGRKRSVVVVRARGRDRHGRPVSQVRRFRPCRSAKNTR